MPQPTPFSKKHEQISSAAMSLQAAMRRSILSIVPHEPGARSLARGLSIDKMLGWQAHRIAAATDAATVLSALPGERGMNLLVKAFAERGCDATIVEALREAAKRLRGAVNHSGATAREIRAIAAGGLDTEAQRRHLERSMKTLHESTVAVRGEVESSEAAAWFVMPAREDPSLASLLSLFLITGLRTIRPLGPRPIYKGVSTYRGKDAWERLKRRRSDRGRIPWMVPEACSPEIDREMVDMQETPNGFLVTADPDLHPTRQLTLGFADLIEGIGSLYETEKDREAELSMQLVMPMRRLQLDIFLHESLPPIDPQLALYFVGGLRLEHGKHQELRRVAGEFEGRFIRSPRTSIASQVDGDRYLKLLEHGTKIAGHPLDAFRCYRSSIAYPPTYTRAVVRWLLPEKPSA